MTFRVKVPANTPAGDTIWIQPVTLSSASTHTQLTLVAGTTDTFQGIVSAPEGTIFRYTYNRNDSFNIREVYVPFATQKSTAPPSFTFREVLVSSRTVSEAIAQWADTAGIEHSTGTIAGRVTDDQGKPLMGILVAAGSHQKETAFDGTYLMDGVPAGPAVITFRTDNGSYRATTVTTNIPADATVIRDVTLSAAPMNTVTFNVTVPSDTPALGVARLFGDAYNLGMTESIGASFWDTTRMLDMTPLGANRWTYTAQVGSGHCVIYLYTLGHHSRNNERTSNGTAVTRPMCADGNITLNDTVVSWKQSNQVAVNLSVVSPTPGEVMYVTTDNAGGFQPLKMWVTGPTTASFTIYATANSTLNYHYQRGATDAVPEIIGQDVFPNLYRSISTGPNGVTLADTVQEWRHEYREPALTTVTTGINRAVAVRSATAPFQTGISPVDAWRPYFLPLYAKTVAKIKDANAQWTQVYSARFVRDDTGELEKNLLSNSDQDVIANIRLAKAQGLKVALAATVYPALRDNASEDVIRRYYDAKQKFFLYQARLAQQEGAEMMILSVDHLSYQTPAMTAYINERWKIMIAAIRAGGYTGKLVNDILRIDSDLSKTYDWYADLDYIGDIYWSPSPEPLGTTGQETVQELYDAMVRRLNTKYLPLVNRFHKPFILTSLGLDSTDRSALMIYTENDVAVQRPTNLAIRSSYDAQARLYQAILLAAAETPWVQGVFSFGYKYYEADDKSHSVRGKTAEQITSQIYKQINARVSSSVPATCTVSAPTITDVHSLSEWGNFTNFASGSYLEIKGANLGQTTRLWSGGDFQDAAAPVSLDNTMVTINGKRAFTYYNSPTQLNVQAPADSTVGNVDIIVTNCAGTSAAYSFQKAAIAPGMLAPPSFKIGGKQYLVALYNDGKTYVGRANLIAGVPFREAKPGDRITAYGVGFGDVVPAVAPGSITGVQNSVAGLTVSFGSTPATVTYKGLAPGTVGLYQFDFIVPDVPEGDTEVVVKVGSTQVAQTLYLTVKH